MIHGLVRFGVSTGGSSEVVELSPSELSRSLPPSELSRSSKKSKGDCTLRAYGFGLFPFFGVMRQEVCTHHTETVDALLNKVCADFELIVFQPLHRRMHQG